MIHQYFGLHADLLWDVVASKLAALAESVEDLVRSLDGERPPDR